MKMPYLTNTEGVFKKDLLETIAIRILLQSSQRS